MAHHLESAVFRERIRKAKKQKRLEEARAALPVLNRREIRLYRSPYHEAVLSNLEESGFVDSYELLRKILEEDSEIDQSTSKLVPRAPLKDMKDQIDTIRDYLKQAEIFHTKGDMAQEIDQLLKLAMIYYARPEDWRVLIERLLKYCLGRSQTYRQDLGQGEATVSYILGVFYTEKEPIQALAKEHFGVARRLSKRDNWNVRKYLGRKHDRKIFFMSCQILYKILLEEARTVLSKDKDLAAAIELIKIGEKYAVEGGFTLGQAEGLLMRGLCEMEAKEFRKAELVFFRALMLYQSENDFEGSCKARINLAKAYISTGSDEQAIYELRALQAIAEKHGLPTYLALAHEVIGEFYLRYSEAALAIPHLMEAHVIYEDLKDMVNCDRSRHMAALAAAQELVPKFFELIGECLTSNSSLVQLLRWKELRDIFWSKSKETLTLPEALETLSNMRSSLFIQMTFGGT